MCLVIKSDIIFESIVLLSLKLASVFNYEYKVILMNKVLREIDNFVLIDGSIEICLLVNNLSKHTNEMDGEI